MICEQNPICSFLSHSPDCRRDIVAVVCMIVCLSELPGQFFLTILDCSPPPLRQALVFQILPHIWNAQGFWSEFLYKTAKISHIVPNIVRVQASGSLKWFTFPWILQFLPIVTSHKLYRIMISCIQMKLFEWFRNPDSTWISKCASQISNVSISSHALWNKWVHRAGAW